MEGSRNPESKTAITKDLFHTGKKKQTPEEPSLTRPRSGGFCPSTETHPGKKLEGHFHFHIVELGCYFFLQTCLETHRFAVWRLPLRSFYQLQIPPEKKTSQG